MWRCRAAQALFQKGPSGARHAGVAELALCWRSIQASNAVIWAVTNWRVSASVQRPFSGFVPHVAQEAMQVQTIMSLVASGLGVGLVASVSRRMMPRGIKCLSLTDNPPGFHVGIALALLPGGGNRTVEKFTEHALRFSSVSRDDRTNPDRPV